jgi:hypothetical protein
MSELIPGISAVYQMEQEFRPHLKVSFLPTSFNDGVSHEGIILQVGDKIIRENMSFDSPADIKKLRNLIWDNFPQEFINFGNSGNSVNKRFPNSKVTQGWQNKKKELAQKTCCKSDLLNCQNKCNCQNKKIPKSILAKSIKHDRYKLGTTNKINKKICKRVRFQECNDNHPVGTATHSICMKEVNWLCNNGYADDGSLKNVKVKLPIDDHKEESKQMKVNKQQFDNLIMGGLFERPNNRAGNKSSNIIEGYHEPNHKMNKNNKNNTTPVNYLIFVIFLILVVLFCFK